MINDPRFPNPDDDIADAASLFGEPPTAVPPPRPTRTPKVESNSADGYAVEGLHDVPDEPIPPVSVERARTPRPPKAAKVETFEDPSPVRPEPSATVEQVWGRGAEWGGTIALIAVGVLCVSGLVFLLFWNEMFLAGFVVMLLSMPALLVAAYPILITLERPVRITPEQAVKDFYSALAHHAPHHRRMWLLLSSAGRVCGSYASYDGFRAYWKRRLAELRGKDAGGLTPLKFQIDDFHSEKSAGLSKIDVSYTVRVYVRGRQAAGPVGSHDVKMSLVKGPDRMWYLNKGTLP